MRKLLPVLFLLHIATVTLAQNQLMIFAGPQMTSANYSVKGIKQETSYKFGFNAGVGMKVPFEGPLYFVPSVFYSMKGYDVVFTAFSFPPDPDAANNSTVIHTFEIAPLLQIVLGKGDGHAFIGGGPSFDVQLFGQEKFDLKAGGTVDRKMPFGFAEYGHFSMNALLRLGYENNSFMICAQYSHGLASINNFDGGPIIKHKGFGITIGKFFNKKKVVMDTRNKE